MEALSLAHPWLLLLGLAIPMLVWLRYFWRGRRSPFRFSDTRRLVGMPLTLPLLVYRLLPWLYALGLTCLVLAIARPRLGLAESRVMKEVIDIALIVDISGSMAAMDMGTREYPERNRLEAVKEVMLEFVKNRPNDRVSVIAFAAFAYTLAPLTFDQLWLEKQIGSIHLELLPSQSTAIGTALGTGVARLEKSESRSKVIILLTDGENNDGQLTPEDAANLASDAGIKVYTIGCGREGEVNMPMFRGGMRLPMVQRVRSHIDVKTLEMIADKTGGKFFRAEDFDALGEVYATIDELERTVIEEQHYTRYEERFLWVAVVGLGLLLMEKLLSLTRVGRLV